MSLGRSLTVSVPLAINELEEGKPLYWNGLYLTTNVHPTVIASYPDLFPHYVSGLQMSGGEVDPIIYDPAIVPYMVFNTALNPSSVNTNTVRLVYFSGVTAIPVAGITPGLSGNIVYLTHPSGLHIQSAPYFMQALSGLLSTSGIGVVRSWTQQDPGWVVQ